MTRHHSLDPAVMTVGPAARAMLQHLLAQADPCKPVRAVVLADAAGIPSGNTYSPVARLIKARVLARDVGGPGLPTMYRLLAPALQHARRIAHATDRAAKRDDAMGLDAVGAGLPAWLGGYSAEQINSVWRERQSQRGGEA